MAQVGPGRRARRFAGMNHAAVGQHRFDRIDDVLDVAVGGAELTRSARGDPTADAAHGDRLRPMADREALRGDFVFGVAAALAGVETRQQIHRVDAARLMHRRHDRATLRLRMRDYAAAHAAAEAERHDRDAGVAARIDRCHDVVDRMRPNDTARPRRARDPADRRGGSAPSSRGGVRRALPRR